MKKIFALGILFLACVVVMADEFQSKAYCLIDMQTGKTIKEKNSLMAFPPASPIKLLTAMIVVDTTPMDKVFTVSAQANAVPPTKIDIPVGDSMKCEDWLLALLLQSANNAAVVLAEGVAQNEQNFVALMNKKAKELGCKNSNFMNSNGLPHKDQYSCAYDLSVLAFYIVAKYPQLAKMLALSSATVTTSSGKKITVSSHSKVLSKGIYGKTGYTDKSRNTFAGFSNIDNKPLAFSILGAPKRPILWEEILRLVGHKDAIPPKPNETTVGKTKDAPAVGKNKDAPLQKNNKNIQTLLHKKGYYSGKIDGVMGAQTKAAIQKFQKENGLKVDGEVGPSTWKKLNE